MYNDLVKRLRDAAKMSEALAVLLPHSEGNAVAKLHRDAADAIETMCEMVATAHGELANVIQSYEESKPRWIPVTERFPEKTNHYLVYIECKCDGIFMSAWVQVAWFCEKFYWEHVQGDDVFKETVTHWMPLPEPPKEET